MDRCEQISNISIAGLFGIERCYRMEKPDIAWAFYSAPHLLYSDENFVEKIVGLKPDVKKHGSYIEVNPVRNLFRRIILEMFN